MDATDRLSLPVLLVLYTFRRVRTCRARGALGRLRTEVELPVPSALIHARHPARHPRPAGAALAGLLRELDHEAVELGLVELRDELRELRDAAGEARAERGVPVEERLQLRAHGRVRQCVRERAAAGGREQVGVVRAREERAVRIGRHRRAGRERVARERGACGGGTRDEREERAQAHVLDGRVSEHGGGGFLVREERVEGGARCYGCLGQRGERAVDGGGEPRAECRRLPERRGAVRVQMREQMQHALCLCIARADRRHQRTRGRKVSQTYLASVRMRSAGCARAAPESAMSALSASTGATVGKAATAAASAAVLAA
jgi:hypothetical protein